MYIYRECAILGEHQQRKSQSEELFYLFAVSKSLELPFGPVMRFAEWYPLASFSILHRRPKWNLGYNNLFLSLRLNIAAQPFPSLSRLSQTHAHAGFGEQGLTCTFKTPSEILSSILTVICNAVPVIHSSWFTVCTGQRRSLAQHPVLFPPF